MTALDQPAREREHWLHIPAATKWGEYEFHNCNEKSVMPDLQTLADFAWLWQTSHQKCSVYILAQSHFRETERCERLH